MASEEKQVIGELPKSGTQPINILPRNPSLARIAIQHMNADELTRTPVNSPESNKSYFEDDSDDDIEEASTENVINNDSKSEIPATEKRRSSYYQNKRALRIALAHLIAARNKANRQFHKEEALMWTNLFVPTTKRQDVADLYHFYNEISIEVLDYCDENKLRYREKKFGPQLPTGFRKASAKERLVLSQKKFAELMKSPAEENPWKTLDIKEIIGDLDGECFDINDEPMSLIRQEDEFINSGCFERTGHFCRKGVCAPGNDFLGVLALKHFEDAGRHAERGLEDLSTKDPKVYSASKNLERVKNSVKEGLEILNDKLSIDRENRESSHKRFANIVNGVLSGQDVKGFFPPTLMPKDSFERPWPDRTSEYISRSYTTRRYLYDLHLLIAATQKDRDALLPQTFSHLWGCDKLQRKASAAFIKQSIAARQSELLLRAGWTPPFFLDMVSSWFYHMAEDKLASFVDSYYHHTFAYRRNLHKAIAAQIISYLCCHLFWYARKEEKHDIEPSDPAWEWHVKMTPGSVDALAAWDNPSDPCTQMYNEYKKEAEMDQSLDDYMPPGFKDATGDQRKDLTERWIKEIVQPAAKYFFSKQEWNKNKSLWNISMTDEQRARVQEHYKDIHYHKKAWRLERLRKRENPKIRALADHGIEFLFEAEKNYGTRNFRTSNSPAIQSAAQKAVEEKDGVSSVPFRGSLLCECDQ